ncbi:hypothetical protein BHU72_14470 [Desulfuribacillus stibiiarsenatis]|uniref:Antitoxin SocA-like Panacea domain-containing protein n=1 Tax=Desulfuribacillus stibiiarsenatis TaxID=1390249 RepID=A0A1E5L7W3_9FIRM|nr:type II toxin-antitoxin system antitoxin SocA domain-containing protein [Desulfuribacillus stibiiarsenatis]OEH86033.1 hypothetical protein BHU72_14470 [Desulfuribacillus stibiiarsenatis]
MLSIKDVTNFFLCKNIPNSKYEITHLKLQKLLYYAQAWHLAIFDGRPLFDEDFEAWVHGPVNREIYEVYKGYGYNILPVCSSEISLNITEEQKKLLEEVWISYGSFTGKYLETLSHQERPWLEARGGIKANETSTNVISKDKITDYYKLLLS